MYLEDIIAFNKFISFVTLSKIYFYCHSSFCSVIYLTISLYRLNNVLFYIDCFQIVTVSVNYPRRLFPLTVSDISTNIADFKYRSSSY